MGASKVPATPERKHISGERAVAALADGKQRGNDQCEHHEVTTHTWKDSDTHIEVLEPPEGFAYNLEVVARVALPPDEVYAILISPTNHTVFRAVKAIRNRRVLEDKRGRQVVAQEQVGRWRLGPLRGEFTSHLLVTQDSHARTVDFRLAKPGFMKDFAGSWEVLPFDNNALDQFINHHHSASPVHRLQTSLQRLEHRLLGHQPTHSLVRLSQSIAPTVVPPPPLNKVLAKIAAKQVVSIMSDLRAEADRRNKQQQDAKQLNSHVKELT